MEIGDRVLCIKGHPLHGLIEGREYIVGGIHDCTATGRLGLDVGIRMDPDSAEGFCKFCHGDLDPHFDIFCSSRFRKVQGKIEYVKKEVSIKMPAFEPILS